jgi:hypothetical protein
MLEQRGMAAAVICTSEFIPSARMTAQTFGMHDYPFAVVQHPIGSCTDTELDEKANAALEQVLELLGKNL